MKVKKFFINMFRFIGAILSLIKGIIVLGMLVIGALTAYLIYAASQVTIDQYNESLTWESTSYETPLAEIEPALISNRIDPDTVDAAASWEALENYLENLDGQSIPDKDVAVTLLDEATHWKEVYGLESNSITRLSLYLALEEAISDAYITLDTGRLQELSQQLYWLELEEPTKVGQKYMERLRTVTYDFAEVRQLMTDTVLSVGTLENGVWTIPYTYTRTDLTEILEQLQNMQKFPALCNTANVLSDIADILNYNKNARDYFAYQEFKEIVTQTTRSRYVAVSSIYTYEQALFFGCSIQLQEVEGYTISMDSPVAGIYYNGDRLDNNEYVKRGTRLIAVIDEIYEPIPEPEETFIEGEDYYEQGE